MIEVFDTGFIHVLCFKVIFMVSKNNLVYMYSKSLDKTIGIFHLSFYILTFISKSTTLTINFYVILQKCIYQLGNQNFFYVIFIPPAYI